MKQAQFRKLLRRGIMHRAPWRIALGALLLVPMALTLGCSPSKPTSVTRASVQVSIERGLPRCDERQVEFDDQGLICNIEGQL